MAFQRASRKPARLEPARFERARLKPVTLAAVLGLAFAAACCATAAKADPCDDLAAQLAGHIAGLKVGAARGGVIYLTHPAVKQAWLGCSSRNVSNAISATSPAKKPSKEFLDLVATAAAVVFTIPKGDSLRGAQRCLGRIGLLRGYNIATRYRKLDIRCSRAKDATQITISRERES